MGGPSVALASEWPKDDYLTIVDQAGNPFEERYAARAARQAGRAGAEGRRHDGGGRGEGRRDRGDGRRDGRGGAEGRHEGGARRESFDGFGDANISRDRKAIDMKYSGAIILWLSGILPEDIPAGL